MDTIIETPHSPRKRGQYRHHTKAFKLAVVQESLQPGASVSRIARLHNLNANQVFAWRKAYRAGALCDAQSTALLPVRVDGVNLPDVNQGSATSMLPVTAGRIELVRRGTILRIDGCADPDTLRLILAHLP